jgi:fatty-acyl-CoA synthase
MITQAAVMANLKAIFNHGFQLGADDRFCSWLPYYHDMGLVGIVLGCVATQRSVDYLPTREFAMRPRLWLTLISRNRCTVSFSPPFGYTLCARRLRPGDAEALDLSAWRVAGVGAEMIHPNRSSASPRSWRPPASRRAPSCPATAWPSARSRSASRRSSAAPAATGSTSRPCRAKAWPTRRRRDAGKAKAFINCGVPLPGYEVEIRDEAGRALPERHCGRIFLRGPSLMSGYFANAEASREVLSADGWLDTGDLGYAVDGALHLTGRAKDLMIIKGRNIWPQDLEHLAEQQPEVRPTDSSAFSITDADDEEMAVLVVQTRESDPNKLALLADRLQEKIHAEFGIQCLIELVTPHTLPRTSSGKLSRSSARKEFVERRRHDDDESPTCFITDETLFRPVARAAAPELALTAGG